MSRPSLEVADILRRHGGAYRRAFEGRLSLGQLKVMSAIEACRTAQMGGHVARCDDRVNIAGVRRADLVPSAGLSPSRLSRQLRRLRNIGVIKRVAGTYRYYLTRIGRAAIAALCRLTQTTIIPALA